MGLSASQARLLSITSRLSDNELRAQTNSNTKMRLASESEEISRRYLDALNAKNINLQYVDENGNVSRQLTYADIMSSENLLASNGAAWCLEDYFGNMIIDKKMNSAFEGCEVGGEPDFATFCKLYTGEEIEVKTWETQMNDNEKSYYTTLKTEYDKCPIPDSIKPIPGRVSAEELQEVEGPYLEAKDLYDQTVGLQEYCNKQIDFITEKLEPLMVPYNQAKVDRGTAQRDLENYEKRYGINYSSLVQPNGNNWVLLSTGEYLINPEKIKDAKPGFARRVIIPEEPPVPPGKGEDPTLYTDYRFNRKDPRFIESGSKETWQGYLDKYDEQAKKVDDKEAAINALLEGTDYGITLTTNLPNRKSELRDKIEEIAGKITNEYNTTPEKIKEAFTEAEGRYLPVKRLWDAWAAYDTAVINKQRYDTFVEQMQAQYPTDYSGSTEAPHLQYYFDRLCTGKYTYNEDLDLSNPEVLEWMLRTNAVLSKFDITKQEWVSDSWSTNTSLVEVPDEADLAKAEAQYNVDMAKLSSKEKRIDLEQKTIDTEHSALQTEYESVKKVIDKNIETTFKMFQ